MHKFKGLMIRKYGLICGPHPASCDCCRTVNLSHFKKIQRKLKRVHLKRELNNELTN